MRRGADDAVQDRVEPGGGAVPSWSAGAHLSDHVASVQGLTEAPDALADRPVLFIHIQKTAGTTLLHRMAAGLGRDQVWPMAAGLDEFARMAAYAYGEVLLEASDDHLAGLQLIGGHHALAVAEVLSVRLARPLPTVTILRDPVERVVSHLKHLRAIHGLHGWPLERVYGHPAFHEGCFVDQQYKVITAVGDELTSDDRSELMALVVPRLEQLGRLPVEPGPFGFSRALAEGLPAAWPWERVVAVLSAPPWARRPADPDRWELAMARLRSVAVLGVTERLPDFVEALERRFGWSLPPEPPHLVSADVPVSDELREQIERDNALDRALYDLARLWAS